MIVCINLNGMQGGRFKKIGKGILDRDRSAIPKKYEVFASEASKNFVLP